VLDGEYLVCPAGIFSINLYDDSQKVEYFVLTTEQIMDLDTGSVILTIDEFKELTQELKRLRKRNEYNPYPSSVKW